jgi:hypothetical protein
MEQRSVVLFLRLKGPSKKAIYHEPVAVLEENVVSHSSVTRFCREAILGLNSEELSSSLKDNGLEEVNEAILLALSDQPFSSVLSLRRIAHMRAFQKALSIVGLSILCISQSDIRHQRPNIRHLH